MIGRVGQVGCCESSSRGATPRSGPIINRQLSIIISGGFTLTELLVVISIVTVLMALLFPVLARARKQARAVACQSILHQWGVALSATQHDNGVHRAGQDNAAFFYEYPGPRQLLCPAAREPLPGPPTGCGDAFHAHCVSRVSDSLINQPVLSSYGHNGWLGRFPPGWRRPWDVADPPSVPVYFDSAMNMVQPDNFSPPPEHEICSPEAKMSPVCINRHHGGINMLFLDFSVRKVGLKELWTLRWSREFNTAGPWTKQGGVKPEDWPQWMRRFKDY